jgi:hypothetical protein
MVKVIALVCMKCFEKYPVGSLECPDWECRGQLEPLMADLADEEEESADDVV